MRTVVSLQIPCILAATLALAGCTTAALFEQELTKTNTQTVLAFEETVFNKHDVEEAFRHYVGDSYVEHDRDLAGVRGEAARGEAQNAYAALLARDGPQTHRSLERSVAQGEFVVTQSLWTRGDRAAVSVADIYRLSAGRIVEHWDVVSATPEVGLAGG
jgi:predicted SnoaL-like aldol condensation-catalyzing enzyme